MPKFIDTNEVVADLGAAITGVLKTHGIDPNEVKVNVMEDQIRILVSLEDEDEG